MTANLIFIIGALLYSVFLTFKCIDLMCQRDRAVEQFEKLLEADFVVSDKQGNLAFKRYGTVIDVDSDITCEGCSCHENSNTNY